MYEAGTVTDESAQELTRQKKVPYSEVTGSWTLVTGFTVQYIS